MKLTHFLVLPLVNARVVRITEQIPIHGEVAKVVIQPIAQDQIASAIGVHFTTSYAVAAVRYQNGTTRDLTRVAGDAEYIDLMSRWARWGTDSKQQDWCVSGRNF
jgi:L-cystine uptake protein TcyP (sodium:dicarboxylate symporter family)